MIDRFLWAPAIQQSKDGNWRVYKSRTKYGQNHTYTLMKMDHGPFGPMRRIGKYPTADMAWQAAEDYVDG